MPRPGCQQGERQSRAKTVQSDAAVQPKRTQAITPSIREMDRGYKLIKVADTVTFPMGIYSKKVKSPSRPYLITSA